MKIIRRFLCVLASCCLFLSGALAQDYPTMPEETIAKLEKNFSNFDTLGACVAVFENGEITYVYSRGECWITGPAITPETAFQVGSISKMVSNIGLMRLMEENGLTLETEIGDVLGYPVRHPEFPNTPVTLRQMMTHTASLRDSGDYTAAIEGKNCRKLQYLFTNNAAFTFEKGVEPGTQRAYSNFGGGLIGALIEKLSGEKVDDYMREAVFAPLGIKASYFAAHLRGEVTLADMYNMPQRYLNRSLREDNEEEREWDPERAYGITAGKLIISAPDLCKLLMVLCDGGVYGDTRLLKESTVREINTLQDHIGSVACETGNGLFLNILENDQVEGRVMHGHGGKAYGMLCAAYYDPSDRTGAVMLTNGCSTNSSHNGVGMLGRQILMICYHDLIDPVHETDDPFLID